MPDGDKKEPRNDSRIVIEPMPEAKPVEKPEMDRRGRINPGMKKYQDSGIGKRRETDRG